MTYTNRLFESVVEHVIDASGDFTSSTFTTVSNSLLVAVVTIDSQAGLIFGNIPTPTTPGTTWTLAKSASINANYTAHSLIYFADSPGAGTSNTISMAANYTAWDANINCIDVLILEFPNGLPAAAQLGNASASITNESGTGRDPGALSITLDKAPLSSSYTLTAFASDGGLTATTPGTGFTELVDEVEAGGLFLKTSIQIRPPGSTSTGAGWVGGDLSTDNSVYDYSVAAVEVLQTNVVTDDFNRANGELGSNWTTIAVGPNISSNRAEAGAFTTFEVAAWTAPIGNGSTSIFVEGDITVNANNGYPGLMLSEANNNNTESYSMVLSNDGTEIYLTRRTGGDTFDIATNASLTLTTGVTYRARFEWLVGGTLNCYINGVNVLTTTNTQVTPSYAGIEFYSGGTSSKDTIDNFRAGTLPRTDPPTLVAFSKSTEDALYSNGNAIAVANSFSWVAGDVIVAAWGIENSSVSYSISMDNETNLTFTAVSVATGNDNTTCAARMYYAVATGSGSGTISGVVVGLGGQGAQLIAWHWTDTDGIGNTVAASQDEGTAPSTPTQTMTAQAQSAVMTAWFDFNATASTWTAETNTGTLTERLDNVHTGRYSMWAGDWVGVSAGSDGWGTTDGTNLILSFPGTIEVLGKTSLDAPTSVTINPVESVSATVSDTAQLTVSNPAITDYIIEYRTTSGPGAWTLFTDSVTSATGVTVTGLSPGVSYDFRVAAKNVSGIGTWSNTTTVTAGSGGIINLKLGDTQISAMKLGDTAITKAYLGDTLVLG